MSAAASSSNRAALSFGLLALARTIAAAARSSPASGGMTRMSIRSAPYASRSEIIDGSFWCANPPSRTGGPAGRAAREAPDYRLCGETAASTHTGERVAWSSPERASHAGRSMPASVPGERSLVDDPARLGPDMAVHRETQPRRRRPRVITRLTRSTAPCETTPERVSPEPARPLAEPSALTTTAVRADMDRSDDR